MDLKEFGADVISQICGGVTDAINKHDETGSVGRINPVFKDRNGKVNWEKYIQNIEFEVSITEDTKVSGKASGGIKVYFVAADAGTDKSRETSMVNRIKFTIPVSLPAHMTDS